MAERGRTATGGMPWPKSGFAQWYFILAGSLDRRRARLWLAGEAAREVVAVGRAGPLEVMAGLISGVLG